MKVIDIASWKRKEHFTHFCGLDDPYWSITTEVDCTKAYQDSKKMGHSFFLSCLHSSLKAVHQVEELRMRIVEGQVVCYDEINASATILRADETFGCCFIEFVQDFKQFAADAAVKIEQTLKTSGMCLENDYMLNQIHYSAIPWCSFSALTFARSTNPQDTVPKMTFGQRRQSGEKYFMPVAIMVHHGLVDGLHVARFLQKFQAGLSQPVINE